MLLTCCPLLLSSEAYSSGKVPIQYWQTALITPIFKTWGRFRPRQLQTNCSWGALVQAICKYSQPPADSVHRAAAASDTHTHARTHAHTHKLDIWPGSQWSGLQEVHSCGNKGYWSSERCKPQACCNSDIHHWQSVSITLAAGGG